MVCFECGQGVAIYSNLPGSPKVTCGACYALKQQSSKRIVIEPKKEYEELSKEFESEVLVLPKDPPEPDGLGRIFI